MYINILNISFYMTVAQKRRVIKYQVNQIHFSIYHLFLASIE